MTTWTREHDAVIARECEGIGVVGDYEMVNVIPGAGACGVPLLPIPNYSIDITACFRAAEVWRKKLDRSMQVDLFTNRNGKTRASIILTSGSAKYLYSETSEGTYTPSQALALALYNAVKGTK